MCWRWFRYSVCVCFTFIGFIWFLILFSSLFYLLLMLDKDKNVLTLCIFVLFPFSIEYITTTHTPHTYDVNLNNKRRTIFKNISVPRTYPRDPVFVIVVVSFLLARIETEAVTVFDVIFQSTSDYIQLKLLRSIKTYTFLFHFVLCRWRSIWRGQWLGLSS